MKVPENECTIQVDVKENHVNVRGNQINSLTILTTLWRNISFNGNLWNSRRIPTILQDSSGKSYKTKTFPGNPANSQENNEIHWRSLKFYKKTRKSMKHSGTSNKFNGNVAEYAPPRAYKNNEHLTFNGKYCRICTKTSLQKEGKAAGA